MDEDTIRWGLRPRTGWVSVTPGAHVRQDAHDDLRAQLIAWQLVLPVWSGCTGLTAARHRGWWMPPLPAGLPVFVTSGRSDRMARRGLAPCRHARIPPWEMVSGVRVTSPAETLLACARDLSLLDVVLLGDAALHVGDATLADLWVVAAQRRRGAPLLRLAIPLMDQRAESIYEGLLRMMHITCEIPVEPQSPVFDAAGQLIARADLRIVGTTRLHEYDGGDHLTRPQQRRDLRRAGRLSDAGFERRGYTREDVLLSASTILRDADRALGRTHRPERIKAWHALLRDSLFSAAGRLRLTRRLGLAAENAEQLPD